MESKIVLFQGDSITDCGRSREDDAQLGVGYAMMVAALHSAKKPEKRTRFLNRGISGNRAKDLLARWKEDCLGHQPDVVSILIGINDVWRRYDSGDSTRVEDFEASYRELLTLTRNKLNAKLVLMEPFVLPTPADRAAWREDLNPKIDAVRRLAREFNAILVPLDGIFAAAVCQREPAFWAADGVHPSSEGHALIAQSWLKAAEGLL